MFEKLASLLAGYFHQDWDVEFNDFVEVAGHFASEADIDDIAMVIGQLLLVAVKDETEIEAFLSESGSYYRPTEGSLDQWLRQFATAIAQAAKDGTKPMH